MPAFRDGRVSTTGLLSGNDSRHESKSPKWYGARLERRACSAGCPSLAFGGLRGRMPAYPAGPALAIRVSDPSTITQVEGSP